MSSIALCHRKQQAAEKRVKRLTFRNYKTKAVVSKRSKIFFVDRHKIIFTRKPCSPQKPPTWPRICAISSGLISVTVTRESVCCTIAIDKYAYGLTRPSIFSSLCYKLKMLQAKNKEDFEAFDPRFGKRSQRHSSGLADQRHRRCHLKDLKEIRIESVSLRITWKIVRCRRKNALHYHLEAD